jgi:hypothetical protein
MENHTHILACSIPSPGDRSPYLCVGLNTAAKAVMTVTRRWGLTVAGLLLYPSLRETSLCIMHSDWCSLCIGIFCAPSSFLTLVLSLSLGFSPLPSPIGHEGLQAPRHF